MHVSILFLPSETPVYFKKHERFQREVGKELIHLLNLTIKEGLPETACPVISQTRIKYTQTIAQTGNKFSKSHIRTKYTLCIAKNSTALLTITGNAKLPLIKTTRIDTRGNKFVQFQGA
jgi:DNA-directed RNA polymerase subunit K/omega